MDALRSARRAHVNGVVLYEQILPFDQLHAHLLRKKRVLEIGRVVGPRRKDRHHRLVSAGGRDSTQVLQQEVRIMLHGLDRLGREQLGKKTHHHLAVFEHVRHPGGDAQVIFEHVILAASRAHDVDTRDMRVDAARHVHALHLAPELRVGKHACGGNHASLENCLIVIDVVQE